MSLNVMKPLLAPYGKSIIYILKKKRVSDVHVCQESLANCSTTISKYVIVTI